MIILEQSIIAKNPKKKSEDGIVVTDDFVAVIDGSTSKSEYRHSMFRSNGRYAMQLTARYIRKMPKNTTSEAFFRGVTAYIRKHYKKSMLSRLAEHPEDRLTCSAVVYSRLNREIWMVGDCQCMINGELFDNPKPAEAELAAMRAEEVKRLIVVPDAEHIFNKVREGLRHADPDKHVTVLAMQPMEGGNFRQEILGYSLMAALGIRSEEINKMA
jgi:glycerophosphoryl diester phosphodiesterase